MCSFQDLGHNALKELRLVNNKMRTPQATDLMIVRRQLGRVSNIVEGGLEVLQRQASNSLVVVLQTQEQRHVVRFLLASLRGGVAQTAKRERD
jgi:hypothetical protein